MANSGERPFEFRVPQMIHVGIGSHERAAAEAARVGGGTVLVVTDANVRATPLAGRVPARSSSPGCPWWSSTPRPGRGSEVTRFAIITDPATSVKMLTADPHLIPDVAIDDPLLTATWAWRTYRSKRIQRAGG